MFTQFVLRKRKCKYPFLTKQKETKTKQQKENLTPPIRTPSILLSPLKKNIFFATVLRNKVWHGQIRIRNEDKVLQLQHFAHHTRQPLPDYRQTCYSFLPTLNTHLECMRVSAFSASVNQESVKASISALSCNQASLFAGPRRPVE